MMVSSAATTVRLILNGSISRKPKASANQALTAIVVFDRIRETKGKAPRLTGEMINTSINQTLSRTLLTSVTTLIVVVLLYFFGGEGIHAFAFALVIGVLVGTYSSIFVASPILLWLLERKDLAAW